MTLATSGGMMPPRTILAATDFTDASISALAFAARLATHCRATLHVLHVDDRSPGGVPGQSTIDLSDRTRREFQRVIAIAAPDAGCSLFVHAMAGRPADVILEVARARRADVVVVGSQGMSDPQKPGFGSTTDELVRRAHLSVIMVPAGWKPPQRAAASLQLPREVKPIHQRTAAGLKRLVKRVNPPTITRLDWRGPGASGPEPGVRVDRAPLVVPVRTAPRSYTAVPSGAAYRMVSLGNAPVLMYLG
jgi:nucleotide-binding universal stress UspA family protein